MIKPQEAVDLFESDDLIGIGMAADAVRRKLHPEGVVTYIIDRDIKAVVHDLIDTHILAYEHRRA